MTNKEAIQAEREFILTIINDPTDRSALRFGGPGPTLREVIRYCEEGKVCWVGGVVEGGE